MSSGNGFADYYESQDQIKCAQEDAFQNWFEPLEKSLREAFEIELEGDAFVEDEFMEFAFEQFEKETK